MNRVIVYKETEDDWSPSYWRTTRLYPDSGSAIVELSLFPLTNEGNDPILWRVAAWGGDDCGIDKDFGTAEEARTAFYELVNLPVINKQTLLDRGFEYF